MRRSTMSLMMGGLGGVTGTVVMSMAMLGARRAGLVGALPPEEMTAKVFHAVGLPRGGRTQDTAASAAHLLFGTAAGTLFGFAYDRLRLPLHGALQGSLYGAMVWFVSYMGWIPAAGLMPPATRDEPRRPPVMVCAHLIYGAVLGTLVDVQARSERPIEPAV